MGSIVGAAMPCFRRRINVTHMDYQQIALGIHLIGFAFGLGGATISDITFFKALRSKSLTSEQYVFLDMLSKVVWAGLILLIISGLLIFWLIYSEQGSLPMLASPRWQTKLTLVGVVLLNGFFFKFSIFPALKKLVGQQLTAQSIGPSIRKLALSGTISIVSWYGIFVVTLLPRTFRPSYVYFMSAYVAVLAVGFIVSKTLMRKMVTRS